MSTASLQALIPTGVHRVSSMERHPADRWSSDKCGVYQRTISCTAIMGDTRGRQNADSTWPRPSPNAAVVNQVKGPQS